MLNFPGYSTFEEVGKLTEDQLAWLMAGLNWRVQQRKKGKKK